MKYYLNDDWQFTENWNEEFLKGEGTFENVRLPHTCHEVPLHYASPDDYEMTCGYRRSFTAPSIEDAPRLFLHFEAAGHQAAVYLNGEYLGEHKGGYTAFEFEITDRVKREEENEVIVKVDTHEDPSIPPFGFVIDYLTYGGLYREAWLEGRGSAYVDDIFVTTPNLNTAFVQVSLSHKEYCRKVSVMVKDGDEIVSRQTVEPKDEQKLIMHVKGAKTWSIEHPYLYTCAVELLDEDDNVIDAKETAFGFRTAVFRNDGFYLNDKKVFIRGLNRHQSYPYMGYAASERLQREDARILKNDLACNAVRTSHYPQSHYFLDECDRLGLLVFTELPGWQHIGDEAWKEQACKTLEEMIRQYRNHPSIVLWGVRINESTDDDDFYTRTNAIAHKLDPSRSTSGVRYLEKSHLLEDVYSYNDFSHNGTNPGVKAKKDVMKESGKPLLISECNGHMFPTKPFDDWSHRQEHAFRHAKVMNDAMADGNHVGCFEWCMFDYPTHKDFGSGDRICYHGVLDAFRNKKPAGYVYASQGDENDVLYVSSNMDIGDYPAGYVGNVYVFTNADEVRFYKNDKYVTTLEKCELTSLPHPPLVVNDRIGHLLESEEGCDAKKADDLRDCLLACEKYGLAGLPLHYKAKFAWCMVHYKMSFEDGYNLYGKYVGNWGGEATTWRFDAIRNEKVVKSVVLSPSNKLHLHISADTKELVEGNTYDMSAVRIEVLDENNNLAPYAQLPLSFETEGDIEIVGPHMAVLEGGMSGAYIKTKGKEGKAKLKISSTMCEPVEITFEIRRKNV